MKQIRKWMLRTIIIGVCLGSLFLLGKIIFQISDAEIWNYYLTFAGVVLACSVIVLVGSIGFNLIYNFRYQKKMNAAIQLLHAGHTEEYIEKMESMLSLAKSRFAVNLLTINLSAGYINLKQYDKAAQLLEPLSKVKLLAPFKVVHRINLCLCYFYQKQTERAMALYEDSQTLFRSHQSRKLYGGNIAILDIHAAISKEDYTQAEELLHTAQTAWDDPLFLEDYHQLEQILCQCKKEQKTISKQKTRGIIYTKAMSSAEGDK